MGEPQEELGGHQEQILKAIHWQNRRRGRLPSEEGQACQASGPCLPHWEWPSAPTASQGAEGLTYPCPALPNPSLPFLLLMQKSDQQAQCRPGEAAEGLGGCPSSWPPTFLPRGGQCAAELSTARLGSQLSWAVLLGSTPPSRPEPPGLRSLISEPKTCSKGRPKKVISGFPWWRSG